MTTRTRNAALGPAARGHHDFGIGHANLYGTYHHEAYGSGSYLNGESTMFQTFAVTFALMKIGVEAGHPDFGLYFPKQIKRSAIKQAKESNRDWGKWQIAMFIISTTRLLAKQGKLIGKKHSHVRIDMRAMSALDEIYEVGMEKLKERNLDRDCVVTRV